MTKERGKHWRRLNPYTCAVCGKPRSTLVFQRAKDGRCTACRKSAEMYGQTALFGIEMMPESSGVIPNNSTA